MRDKKEMKVGTGGWGGGGTTRVHVSTEGAGEGKPSTIGVEPWKVNVIVENLFGSVESISSRGFAVCCRCCC